MNVGEIVECKITGIQPYGAFVTLDNDITGLIHISEISEGYVKDVSRYVKVNEHVTVKVIDFDSSNNHARLSLKAVNPSNFRKVRNRRKDGKLPKMEIGFKTIANIMPVWIEERLKEFNDDKI